LIGTSAVGLRDFVATPRSAAQPGVEVHAEIIDQILSGEFLTRPDWAPGAEIVVAAVLTLLLLAGGPLSRAGARRGRDAHHHRRSDRGIVVRVCKTRIWCSIRSAECFGAQRLHRGDGSAPPSHRPRAPICPSCVLAISGAGDGVERLAQDPEALTLGGETREITILFSDIRGFTSLSENMDPQEITGLLNRFLTPMTDVTARVRRDHRQIYRRRDHVLWNAPLSTPDHPRRSCLAALAMLKALEELNKSEGQAIKIGVGLNTGACCVGNLGSEQRFSYSAIGDSVNVAARVEGLTKQYGLPVLITENTVAHTSGLALLEVDLVRVIGRAEPIAGLHPAR
jgi:adenylate cyclase